MAFPDGAAGGSRDKGRAGLLRLSAKLSAAGGAVKQNGDGMPSP